MLARRRSCVAGQAGSCTCWHHSLTAAGQKQVFRAMMRARWPKFKLLRPVSCINCAFIQFPGMACMRLARADNDLHPWLQCLRACAWLKQTERTR
jgi:hypothetical protein